MPYSCLWCRIVRGPFQTRFWLSDCHGSPPMKAHHHRGGICQIEKLNRPEYSTRVCEGNDPSLRWVRILVPWIPKITNVMVIFGVKLWFLPCAFGVLKGVKPLANESCNRKLKQKQNRMEKSLSSVWTK
eukprot:TRINITY_DN15106_c0_g1_i1.p1 TRINITY_DN15106_c0_g1~~TRINITY_DN15106_c0_g1_i1.p1  ORF type:complete len:129 (+),score=6.71 TRINITY_DN15106_c0_g1_i1:318-704(+)